MMATSRNRKPKKTEAQLHFGGWLKAMRAARDIPAAADAAKKAGVDATTWRALEAPGMPWHAPTPKTIRGIAEVFGVPVEEVAARAGVTLPSLDGFAHPSATPPEMMEMLGRILEQLAEAQRQNAELLTRLAEGSAPARRGRPRSS